MKTKKKLKYSKRKKCVVCENDIPDKRTAGSKITCSKRCSKTYTRISRFIQRRIRENVKRELEERFARAKRNKWGRTY